MLELDITTIVFEIFNFLLLTLLLYRFLFQPVLRTVQARAEKKAQLLRETEQARQAAGQLQAELTARLAQAEAEAAQILAAADEQAQAERVRLLTYTQTEIERILAGARLEASQLQQQATESYHRALVETILDTSLHTIERVAPPELHGLLVKQLSDQVWELGQNGMQQVQAIRRSLQGRSATVSISTAQALTPEQHNLLASTFSALADQEVQLAVKTEPDLVAGLRVRLGDTVMDHSMAGKLTALQSEISEAISHDHLPDAPTARPATVAEATPA